MKLGPFNSVFERIREFVDAPTSSDASLHEMM